VYITFVFYFIFNFSSLIKGRGIRTLNVFIEILENVI